MSEDISVLKMICQRLDSLDAKMSEGDKKLMWLCTHSTKTGVRLNSIEENIQRIKDHIEKHDEKLDIFETRISTLEGKVIVTAIIITAVFSLLINMVINL